MPHLPPQPPGLLSPTIPDLFATLRALRCQSNASSTRIWKVNSRFHSNVSARKTITATTLRIQANILGIPHHSPPLRWVHVLLAALLSVFSSPPFSSACSFSPPSQMPLFSDRGNRGTLLRKQTLLCDNPLNCLLLPNVMSCLYSGATEFYFV